MNSIVHQSLKTLNSTVLRTLKAKCGSRLVYLAAMAFWAVFIYIMGEMWRKVVE